MLEELINLNIYNFMLVFCRMGTFFLNLPGIGETFIPTRVRLSIALVISLVMTPIVATHLPIQPVSEFQLLLLIISEITIGLFLSLFLRLFMTTLSIAGAFIALVSGYASIQFLNPFFGGQGSLHSVLMTLLGTHILFATDFHNQFFYFFINSYQILIPGAELMFNDMLKIIAEIVSDTFLLGFQLTAPFFIVNIVLNLIVGLTARLMPQMQVFFVMLPLQLLLGSYLLVLILPAMMNWFLMNFQNKLMLFGV